MRLKLHPALNAEIVERVVPFDVVLNKIKATDSHSTVTAQSPSVSSRLGGSLDKLKIRIVVRGDLQNE